MVRVLYDSALKKQSPYYKLINMVRYRLSQTLSVSSDDCQVLGRRTTDTVVEKNARMKLHLGRSLDTESQNKYTCAYT